MNWIKILIIIVFGNNGKFILVRHYITSIAKCKKKISPSFREIQFEASVLKDKGHK